MQLQNKNTIVENGNAAIINNRSLDTVIFESGRMYKLYGRKSDRKLRFVGESESPDFENWDEYFFQRQYNYLGVVKVIKIKRTLKLSLVNGG